MGLDELAGPRLQAESARQWRATQELAREFTAYCVAAEQRLRELRSEQKQLEAALPRLREAARALRHHGRPPAYVLELASETQEDRLERAADAVELRVVTGGISARELDGREIVHVSTGGAA